jgi:hypothetical protein
VEPVDWGKRGTEPLAVPASTKHVQLVITGGATRDEHYAWLIANGTDVIGVFRASSSEVADVIGAAAGAARVAVASPLQTASFVAIGTIYAPPPPPPPHGKPPFFPPIYVEDVMRLAWNVSHTAEIEGDRLSAAGAAQQ